MTETQEQQYYNIAIVGSRYINGKKDIPRIEYKNYDFFCGLIYESIKNAKLVNKPIRIISGGALGIDSLAERYANEHKIAFLPIKPEYTKYPWKVAPLHRNTIIANMCDEMIAIQINDSSGTNDVVGKARALNKMVNVFPIVVKI